MRLLNSRSKQLELLHRGPTRYAIVSHRWGDESEEVLFIDIGDQARAKSKIKGYDKIVGACDQAVRDGLDYVWLDTCCIDKSNSTELSEAINAMYRWYQKSKVCYAYLHDVSDGSEFTKSEWFTRGWTLQELIAPKVLKFFTKDWSFIGTREDLIDPIAERTGISPEVLRSGKIPQDVSISQRMFWAANRETTEVEDRAYSMLGILGVSMYPNYGIVNGAFDDLQRRIIEKYSDQTLFAWYHTIVPPEDVEMTDADPASTPPPDPAPDPAPESVEGDTGSPSPNATGLFASSPSQYLVSYEIPENEFRTNYIDDIREYSYRSHFSISNNLVHISLPIKHVSGKIWKAVLRCSFEPPGGDQPQRPLVIYLEQISPVKYYRVHLTPDKEEEFGDNQPNDVPGLGSLERLSDAEVKLEGYILRDIDVVAWYVDNTSEERQRPLPGDPDAPSEIPEAERIRDLPRHPPGTKTTNIIICGEPGVAAGRVINLITGKIIIKPLTDYEREAMAVTPIDATLQSRNIRIFYVIGPRDPYLDPDVYYTIVRNMYQLVQQAKESGGIHLVLLCMVGSRVTAAVETNYRLFNDCICCKQVPVMLIVTGLGKTRRMEDWWDKHKNDSELQAMRFQGHACITVLQGDDEEHAKKYKDSVQMVQQLLMEFMEGFETTPKVFSPEDVNRWFVYMGSRAMESVLVKKAVKQEAITKALKEGDLSEVDASNLARQFFDEHAMEF